MKIFKEEKSEDKAIKSLSEINQEIISAEFQFSDATGQINPNLKAVEGLTIPESLVKRSNDAVNRSIELNKNLIDLLDERKTILENMLLKA